ncbi:MAG: type II toxin-antitoxin system RelE/ParE family toxin [Rhodomicrobium sp.]
MAIVQITASADTDIADIVSDLAAKAGIATAERYAAGFDVLFDRLADFPDIGAPRPKLGPHTRIGIVPPYVAVYDHKDDLVTVLRVLHGRRNITARLIRL